MTVPYKNIYIQKSSSFAFISFKALSRIVYNVTTKKLPVIILLTLLWKIQNLWRAPLPIWVKVSHFLLLASLTMLSKLFILRNEKFSTKTGIFPVLHFGCYFLKSLRMWDWAVCHETFRLSQAQKWKQINCLCPWVSWGARLHKYSLFVEFIDLIHVAEHNMLLALDAWGHMDAGVRHGLHVALWTEHTWSGDAGEN